MMKKRGFTLIELMIVVAIIGILAAIAIPKFADLISKSREGAIKGQLSSVRSAINVYYSDNEGIYPTDTLDVLVPKYIKSIPLIHFTGHAGAAAVAALSASDNDGGSWGYFNTPGNNWGTFMVDCTHGDSKGAVWTSI